MLVVQGSLDCASFCVYPEARWIVRVSACIQRAHTLTGSTVLQWETYSFQHKCKTVRNAGKRGKSVYPEGIKRQLVRSLMAHWWHGTVGAGVEHMCSAKPYARTKTRGKWEKGNYHTTACTFPYGSRVAR